jgi:plasmid replication initiation protein
MPKALQTQPNQQVKQHNALINASYNMNPTGLRLFLAGLSRLQPDDDYFHEYKIPFSEIIGTSDGGRAYELLEQTCEDITKRNIYMEVLNDDGTRDPEPDYDWYTLIITASYRKKQSCIIMEFHHKMRPYLLNLKENGHFTISSLSQVLKLKGSNAFRIYWLLREHSAFGRRRIGYDDLRFVLKLEEKYKNRFNGFKDRILDPAQEQLATTDMAFTYEPIYTGRTITAIDFQFVPKTRDTKRTAVVRDKWAELLRSMAFKENFIEKIAKEIQQGLYEEGYIAYCVQKIVDIRATTPELIKNPRGYLNKALLERWWVLDYSRARNLEKKRALAAKNKREHVMTMAEVELKWATETHPKRHTKFTEEYPVLEIFISSYLEGDQMYKAELRDGEAVWTRPLPAGYGANQPTLDI